MIQWVIFTAFLAFGVVMVYVGVTQFWLQRELTATPRRVTATIVSSEVKASESADTNRDTLRSNSTITYRPDVRFAYEINGKPYESDLLYPTIIVRTYASHGSAAAELKPFPAGATVEAYYGVNRPAQAYLVHETSAGPVIFIIVGLIAPVAAFLVLRYLV